MSEPTAVLLTGRPGCGKTTIVRQIVARLQVPTGGFYTEEVRDKGHRRGFRIITFHGQEATLADVDLKSRYRVSRYGVNLESLDTVAVPALESALADAHLIVMDEIGKMEIFSQRFRHAVAEALASGRPVLGTVMLTPHPWVDSIKAMSIVRVLKVTPENRAQVRQAALQLLLRCLEGA